MEKKNYLKEPIENLFAHCENKKNYKECLEPFGQLKKNSLRHRWENSDWYSSVDDENLKWAKEEWGFVQFSCTSVYVCTNVCL